MSTYRIIDGVKRKRVTAVLDVIAKPALYYFYAKYGDKAKSIAMAAAKRGTNVHKAIELYHEGVNIETVKKDLTEDERKYFRGYELNNERYTIKTKKASDQKVIVSKEFDYCGEIDELCDILDKKTGIIYKDFLGDYKTGKNIYYTHRIQLAAYFFALIENKINVEGAFLLHLNNKSFPTFEMYTKDDMQKDFEIFKAALIIYEDMEKKGEIK